MSNIILAIVGLAGAGKTEATNYIKGKEGWPKIYFGQAVIDGVKARGWPLNEDNEKKVREQLRAEHGIAALAIANLPKLKELFEQGNVLVESLYSWEEYLLLKKQFGENFKVLAIYSSFATRAQRLAKRPERPLTPEQLDSRDIAQIENIHQAGPIARADWTIVNESSMEDFYISLDNIIFKTHESPH